MIEVTLSPLECRLGKYLGRVRNIMSLDTKTNARRDPAQNDEEMNIQGAGAEIAVAKLMNVFPELSPTRGELPKWDLVIHNEQFDVKRNHLPDGDLLVPNLYENIWYILACGTIPSYNIIGFLSGIDVKKNGEWVNLTYGPCWRVRPQKLIPIEDLLS